MIIFRQKKYSEQEQPSPRDLQLENMKMQRQIMMNQRQREKLMAQEQKEKLKTIQAAQKVEQKEDQQNDKNQLQAQKMNKDDGTARNVGLYKTRSSSVQPVAMPKK